MEVTIPTREITQCITIKINLPELKFRLRLAAIIFRFGAWVSGCKCEVEVGSK